MIAVQLPCGHTVSESWLLSQAARIASGRRVKPVGGREVGKLGGRPVVLRQCPRCGAEMGTAALQRHKCAQSPQDAPQ